MKLHLENKKKKYKSKRAHETCTFNFARFKLLTILLDKRMFRDFDFRDEQLIYEVICTAVVQ